MTDWLFGDGGDQNHPAYSHPDNPNYFPGFASNPYCWEYEPRQLPSRTPSRSILPRGGGQNNTRSGGQQN